MSNPFNLPPETPKTYIEKAADIEKDIKDAEEEIERTEKRLAQRQGAEAEREDRHHVRVLKGRVQLKQMELKNLKASIKNDPFFNPNINVKEKKDGGRKKTRKQRKGGKKTRRHSRK